MTAGDYNLFDIIILPFNVAASLVLTGLGTVAIYGYSFSGPLPVGFIPEFVTLSTSVAVVTYLLAYLSNDRTDVRGLSDMQQFALGAGLLSVAVLSFVPGAQELVASEDFVALSLLGVQSAAYYVLAYY